MGRPAIRKADTSPLTKYERHLQTTIPTLNATMKRKTLLLVFIHGFKGDHKTFASFPDHVKTVLSPSLPNTTILPLVYPAYETRGDLAAAVASFRSWLLDHVIDLEVAAETPSPSVAPSVHIVLVGHSMGGIVAADALLGIASEQTILPSEASHGWEKNTLPSPATNLFPNIRGVLAMDTPYLGISPGVLAYGAEAHYQAASSTLAQLSGLGMFGGGAAAAGAAGGAKSPTTRSADALRLPAAEGSAKEKKDEAPASGWGNWGKLAVIGGAAVLAAGGAAAYAKRREIGEGVNWATSHLAFVGCLMRPEELRARVAGVEGVSAGAEVGWVNLYTKLGRGAEPGTAAVGRTFCNLPKGGKWKEELNDKARDEVTAHMNMFAPAFNPGYGALTHDAADYILKWTGHLFTEVEAEAGPG
ncbi:hypothetical protein VE00_03355 [Pseudogymnoascus sp. WSF 3629]|nr:hypothetical protein VE00_03355 [Pseudogymnoascus sp. WSF 3629]